MTDLTSQEHAEIADRLRSMTRFAGWLGKDQSSNNTRAHLKELAVAVEGHTDVGQYLLLLEADLQRVPSGEVRKMIRRELDAIATLLTKPLTDDRTERS